jgi:hypothetical protein
MATYEHPSMSSRSEEEKKVLKFNSNELQSLIQQTITQYSKHVPMSSHMEINVQLNALINIVGDYLHGQPHSYLKRFIEALMLRIVPDTQPLPIAPDNDNSGEL